LVVFYKHSDEGRSHSPIEVFRYWPLCTTCRPIRTFLYTHCGREVRCQHRSLLRTENEKRNKVFELSWQKKMAIIVWPLITFWSTPIDGYFSGVCSLLTKHLHASSNRFIELLDWWYVYFVFLTLFISPQLTSSWWTSVSEHKLCQTFLLNHFDFIVWEISSFVYLLPLSIGCTYLFRRKMSGKFLIIIISLWDRINWAHWFMYLDCKIINKTIIFD